MKFRTINIKNVNLIDQSYLVLASFFFSIMTICVKKVDAAIPIYELVFFRSIFSLIITSLIIKKKKINPWGINKGLLILRGLLGTFALLCIFYSIKNMPLSISTVIQYTYPIFIAIFGGIFINERFNTVLILALIFGWLGIFIIINPYQISNSIVDINNFAVIIAFIGAICTSLAYIAVKKLSEKEDVFIIIKYFPLVSVISLSPLVILNWITPKVDDFIWIIGIGIFTQMGQTFLTKGLKKLKASQAASINYLQVIFGSIWGIYIFEETININFIIGSGFVLLGTIISTSQFNKKV
ncbi:MAG: EamA family transporter [Prochlorococcus sp. SP3034]|nr:EamA family transporter [Prochlorococcus sp. SP3034]|tara:strand:- start:413 stop:1303 length:891 start_codon:yes stop_codon:yes gene_type:complete